MFRKVLKVVKMSHGEYRYTLTCGHKQTGKLAEPKKVDCVQCGGIHK